MRLRHRCGWLAGLGAATLLVALFGVASSAEAAFPGRNGLLAVQPLKGSVIVLVNANGSGVRRVCPIGIFTALSGPVASCTALPPYASASLRPAWARDGRTLVVTPGRRPFALIYQDGSCLACLSPFSSSPVIGSGGAAFTSDPTLLTAVWRVLSFAASGQQLVQYMLVQFGIDGLARQVLLSRSSPVSDPVWSSRGELAVVQAGWIWVGSPGKLRRFTRGSSPSWSPDLPRRPAHL